MTNGSTATIICPHSTADPEVAERISAFSEAVRADPMVYLVAAHNVLVAAGMGRLLPQDPVDDKESPALVAALGGVRAHLGSRDDKEAVYDSDSEAALSADPTYQELLQALQADRAVLVRGRTHQERKSETANTKREQLSMYRLWFFIKRVAAKTEPPAAGQSATLSPLERSQPSVPSPAVIVFSDAS